MKRGAWRYDRPAMGGDEARSGEAVGRAWTLGGTRRRAGRSGTPRSSPRPIVLSYEVGLLLLGDRGVRNAADALIDQGLTAFGRPVALVVNLLVLAAFLVVRADDASRGRRRPFGLFFPVLLESALYACVLAPALMAIVAPPHDVGARACGVAGGRSCSPSAPGSTRSWSSGSAPIGGLAVAARSAGSASRAAGRRSRCSSCRASGFSLFHHVGPGAEPFATPGVRDAFRRGSPARRAVHPPWLRGRLLHPRDL